MITKKKLRTRNKEGIIEMSHIFLSHSKKDISIIDTFKQAFSSSNVKPILMEYENFQNPPWKEIQNKIRTSSALFVLLGPNLKNSDYTQNWVSYEVGIADSFNKPIWVFEDINNQILFPIPHVNNYLIYDPSLTESLEYLQTIIKSYAISSVGALGGLMLTAAITSNPLVLIAGTLLGSKIGIPTKPAGTKIICPYFDCKITFEFYNNNQTIRCPSCRRTLTCRPI